MCIRDRSITRKEIKELLQKNVTDIEFHRPSQRNQPEIVSMKPARDIAMTSQNDDEDLDLTMRSLYDAASLL